VLYGGAAGGGKTEAALIGAAQFVHVPGYAALILRENFADLNQPDAVIPRSRGWWLGTDAKWNERDRRWTFPSGATVTFGYLDSDAAVYQYQGAAYQYIYVDELTQHTEWRYQYLFSRLRRPAAGPLAAVPLRMRGGSNPGGRGHAWVKRRFVDPATREPGAAFVAAKLADNPSLPADDYARSLSHVDPVTRKQLLEGDWDAVEGGLFKREWFRWHRRDGDFIQLDNGERFRPDQRPVFMTCDPAATEKQTADWTVLSTFCVSPKANLVWLGCLRWRKEAPDLLPLIHAEYRRWRPKFIGVEQVAANNQIGQFLRRMEPKPVVKPLSPKGEDKKVRAVPATIVAHNGELFLPEDNPAFPLDDVIGELTRFTGVKKADGHNDIVDTLSYGVECLHELAPHGASKPAVPAHHAGGGGQGAGLPGRPAAGIPGVVNRSAFGGYGR
jgi:phage terminase large subunit-like protein